MDNSQEELDVPMSTRTNSHSVVALNKRRTVMKSKITKMQNVLDSFDSTTPSANCELNIKLKGVLKMKTELECLQMDYCEVVDDPVAALEDLDEKLEELEVRISFLLSNVENVVQNNESIKDKGASVKLPEIPLPMFSGKFEDFTHFKLQFTNLIVNNKKLNDSQRLYYLQAALKGEAKGIETNDDTFESLFSALKERFENKRLVVESLIKNLINYHNITNESAKELRLLSDTLKKNLRSLKSLNYVQNDLSDIFIINVLTPKLDRESRKQYELSLKSKEVPTLDEFVSFLESRSIVLENLHRNVPYKITSKSHFQQPANKTKSLVVKSDEIVKKCYLCNDNHFLFKCSKFILMDVPDRYNFVKSNKLCLNCLNKSHNVSQCRSKFSCSQCGKKHNSLLHKSNENETGSRPLDSEGQTNAGSRSGGSEVIEQVHAFSTSTSQRKTVLLSTAVIFIEDRFGDKHEIRAILDSGSSSCFLTHGCADLLQLKRLRANISVSGINGAVHEVNTRVVTRVSDSKGEFNQSMEFFIVPNITSLTPSTRLEISDIKIPEFVHLADPDFYVPGRIQALIGNEFFFEILKCNKFRTWDNKLLLQDSVFGYLVSGTLPTTSPQNACFFSKQLECLDKSVKQFFELEAVPEMSKPILSVEETYVEEHFAQNHMRQPDGRYVVKLPVNENNLSKLSDTFGLAKKRVDSTWNRLERDPVMKTLYTDFLSEYVKLGHMEESTTFNSDSADNNSYFLPHHGIFKPEKSSSKLRVVFDASAKSDTGISLNDVLMKGPILQDDLFSLLLRFRKHKYVVVADIIKMYRQIAVHPSQWELQKILWKWGKQEPLRSYNLTTVTYGTSCAPYLATRTIKQLAEDERVNFPEASAVLSSDLYMDDILSGESTIERTKVLQTQLVSLLERGQFQLHKWSSNAAELLSDIPDDECEYSFNKSSDSTSIKTLGMLWNPSKDLFSFKVNVIEQDFYTKRDVLSQIARIFDPLGLIGPITTKMKVFLQKLWLSGKGWTDNLDEPEATEWQLLVSSLVQSENLSFPRFVLQDSVIEIYIKGFADASTYAYGAVVYIKSISQQGNITTNLLCSRSRVAPIKPVTVPRLELSACVLLSKLVSKVLPALQLDVQGVHLYSDSTIALAWIVTPPHKLKTFVSHRVNTIQTLTEDFSWRHVPSAENPADILSRGASPAELLSNQLWFHGPPFLLSPDEPVTTCATPGTDDSDKDYHKELKESVCLLLQMPSELELIKNVSSYSSLLRIIAYCFRFCHNAKNRDGRISGALKPFELDRALTGIVKNVQHICFAKEIHELTQGRQLPSNSRLLCLSPFLDESGVLRVGGRLKHSELPNDQRHPLLLPSNHEFVKLLVMFYHISNLHSGPQQTLYVTRLKFWIMGGRNLIRKLLHQCLTCRKANSKATSQRMADLPSVRVTASRPFSRVGIDYAGPFPFKEVGGRGKKVFKCYICIFVCFVVKATHIEIVNSLESSAFLAALKRFIARRGKPVEIFCDRGTNFVGANNELKKILKTTFTQENRDGFADYLSREGIRFNFNPPAAPHFGGLWEAGVKSLKYHMKRVIGNSIFTLEQLHTLVAQIEAVMNSRPLCPLSNDPNDYSALTPGHFLIGCALVAIPESDLTEVPMNRLTRFQTIQKLLQSFWKRWTNEYLSTLQSRNKWKQEGPALQKGQLVLLKNEALPVLKWKLARIIEVHPSKDNRIRVVTVQCDTGSYKRPITQVAPLPFVD